MLRRHPRLLLAALIIASVVAPPNLAVLFGRDPDTWALLGLVLGTIALFPVLILVARRDEELKQANYDRRLEPVKRSVETCWRMTETRELDYRHRLVEQLFSSLEVPARPEAPLPSGTRVDAYMEFEGEDWYITIKRGLDNQKRLKLQGEIEDIIHAPQKDRDLWICVVVGVSHPLDFTEVAHLKQLCEYVAQHSIVDARAQRTRNGDEDKPRVNIEVLPAIIPTEPIEELGMGPLELAPA